MFTSYFSFKFKISTHQKNLKSIGKKLFICKMQRGENLYPFLDESVGGLFFHFQSLEKTKIKQIR